MDPMGSRATFTAMSLRRPCCRSCSAARSAIARPDRVLRVRHSCPPTSTDGENRDRYEWQNPCFRIRRHHRSRRLFSFIPGPAASEANQVLNIAGGPYDIENFRAKTTVVFQNMVPTSQYRAVGHPMGIVICDSLLDKAAVAAGIDRMEIRRRNLISDDAYPAARRPVSRCMTYLIRHVSRS